MYPQTHRLILRFLDDYGYFPRSLYLIFCWTTVIATVSDIVPILEWNRGPNLATWETAVGIVIYLVISGIVVLYLFMHAIPIDFTDGLPRASRVEVCPARERRMIPWYPPSPPFDLGLLILKIMTLKATTILYTLLAINGGIPILAGWLHEKPGFVEGRPGLVWTYDTIYHAVRWTTPMYLVLTIIWSLVFIQWDYVGSTGKPSVNVLENVSEEQESSAV